MKSTALILALFTIFFNPNLANACSKGKLLALKQRCMNADSTSARALYCSQKQNPHSIKLVEERNYNIGK